MKPAERFRVWGMLAFALATGCDAQVSPRFTGEALLTITGSVQIQQPDHGDLVVPALAFWIPSKGEVRIQDVEVQGEFPSDFRLDVYEPPPTEAYFEATRQGSGEPRMAAGYITAVAADHPSTIQAPLTPMISRCASRMLGTSRRSRSRSASVAAYHCSRRPSTHVAERPTSTRSHHSSRSLPARCSTPGGAAHIYALTSPPKPTSSTCAKTRSTQPATTPTSRCGRRWE
jgi:hypothetical protein